MRRSATVSISYIERLLRLTLRATGALSTSSTVNDSARLLPASSALTAVQRRPLNRTELNFIIRVLIDANTALFRLHSVRVTESRIGDVVKEETSFIVDHRDSMAALDLAQRLLGWTGASPPYLDEQLGLRACIEASGDPTAGLMLQRLQQARRDLEASRRQPRRGGPLFAAQDGS